ERRVAVWHGGAAAPPAQIRRRACSPAGLAHVARGVFGPPHRGGAERQALYRAGGCAHRGRRRSGPVDQGRQRDGVRRLQLRLAAVIGLLLTARALRAFADGFVAVLLPAYLLALGHGQLEVGLLSTATLFLPLEHTVLALAAPAESRTSTFARYSFVGSLFAAVGALAAAVPDWLTARAGVSMVGALRAMFLVYAAIGLAVWLLYLRLPVIG